MTIQDLIRKDGKWLGGVPPTGWYIVNPDNKKFKMFFRASASFHDWKGVFGSTK